MAPSLTNEINKAFGLTSERREAHRVLTPKQMVTFSRIEKLYEGRVRAEKRSFEIEYKSRFEMARKRLIDQAGSRQRQFRHRWFGSDNFDKAAINRQADRVVRHEFQKRLSQLKHQYVTESRTFLDHCKRENHRHEKPTHEFNRVTDRRTGQERRQRQSPIRHR